MLVFRCLSANNEKAGKRCLLLPPSKSSIYKRVQFCTKSASGRTLCWRTEEATAENCGASSDGGGVDVPAFNTGGFVCVVVERRRG